VVIEKVWAEYKTGVKRFIKSKVSNQADAEDLMQEVLIKTYKSLDKLKSQNSIKSWIFQIANNTIIDYYRKNGKVSHEILEEHLMYEENSEDAKKALSKCIEPFIKELSKESSDLLTAIDLDGESQKEYAKENGIKYSTLKSKVKKSREELRTVFEDCCTMSFDKNGSIIDYKEKTNKKC